MYVRQVEDQELTLRVSGKLWMRSLVMSDLETGSEWAHLLGRAMKGPLRGKELKPLVSDMVTWAVWKETHPETTVMRMPARRTDYTSLFYRDPTRFVFGLKVNGKAWALPLADLQTVPLLSFEIEDQPLLATYDAPGVVPRLFSRKSKGQVLEFSQTQDRRMKDAQTGSIWSCRTGRAIQGPLTGSQLEQHVGIMSFRKAWQDFHPNSNDVLFPSPKPDP